MENDGTGEDSTTVTETSKHSPESTQSPSKKPSSKLFIGGVSWETRDNEFRDYFAAFGKMSDCVLMRDRNTGRSRGFGFVTYVNEEDKHKVLATELELSGRKLDAKEAVPKDQQQEGPSRSRGNGGIDHRDIKKIFVGALSQETTQDEFDDYFKAYGEVTDSVIMIDKHTGRSRGFGFVSYKDSASVEAVLEQNHHEIHGKRVDCKRAVPRREQMKRGYSTSTPFSDWGYDNFSDWNSGDWGGYSRYGGNKYGQDFQYDWNYNGGSYGGYESGYANGPDYGPDYGPRWGAPNGGPPNDHPYYNQRGGAEMKSGGYSRYRPY